MSRHAAKAWAHGTEALRISEQYAGRPQDGIVFSVQQRTTGAGRSVLLTPDDAAAVRDWLTQLLGASR